MFRNTFRSCKDFRLEAMSRCFQEDHFTSCLLNFRGTINHNMERKLRRPRWSAAEIANNKEIGVSMIAQKSLIVCRNGK